MFVYLYKIIKKLKAKIGVFMAINWLRTIYFNFKMLPYKQAKKLPFILYGKVTFTSLQGRVNISVPAKFGMVRIGENLEIIRRNFKRTELRIDGFFYINGNFSTGNDIVICITKDAILEVGEGTYLGANTKIICTRKVSIGKFFRFGYESQISDSNYHYIVDKDSGKIQRLDEDIIIGDYTWVGNRTSIMKGTKTPKYLIVASNSLLNRDYSLTVEENSVLGGIPAKVLKKGVSRVYDAKIESDLNEYFRNNPDQEFYFLNK